MIKIVAMRKMDLLLYHREQEKFLDELRGLGVVHITSEQQSDSSAAQELRAKVQYVQRALIALKKVQFKNDIRPSAVPTEDVPRLLTRYEECDTKRERVEQEFAMLSKDNSTLAPWGDFDPHAVKRLADIGVMIRFYTMPDKKFDALDKSKLIVKVAAVRDGVVYFAVVYRGEAPEVVGAENARLPEISLKDLNAKVQALELRRNEVNSDMNVLAGHIAEIEAYCASLKNQIQFEQARTSMQSEASGKIYRMSGWVPKHNEAKVTSFLQGYSACATFRDPTADDDVPINVKSGGVSKLFEPILKLYTLPAYSELNFAPLIAPFFILFFGLCLGDLGYGALFFLGALIALFKVGPKMKPFMMLGVIFGISTMVCGVLLNGFFGAPIFGGEAPMSVGGEMIVGKSDPGLFSPSGGVGNALLAPLNPGGGTVYPAMGLAMLIGFVQVFFGMAVKSYIGMKNRGFFAGLEPLSLIAIATGAVIMGAKTKFMGLGIESFSVGRFNIGVLLQEPPMWAAQALVFGGIALLLLFNNINKKIYVRPLSGLWALYNFITGFLSNILSYLRLFALGLAGGLLGAAVNQVAFMVRDATAGGGGGLVIVGVVGMVILMIGGHALNMALASLSAFVHPLRLTFVEFYSAVGFKGGGKPYVPFAKVEN